MEHRMPRAKVMEDVGVSSATMAALMQDVVDAELELHSVMVVRGGTVAYENFRKPYSPNIPHVMFSVSKSVTSCAIGFAVEEGLFSLDDRVIDLVPELKPEEEDPDWELMTVRHLITMGSGKLVSILSDKSKKQWVKDFSEAKWQFKPGEGFSYSNENIYILCVILEHAAGMGVVDFLMPRLFEPLGIPRPFWEDDGNGVEAGGWGLYLSTESFAKIMTCYAQEGKFEGKQIIPAQWVKESGSSQNEHNVGNPGEDEHGNNGYGYCFWMNTVPGSFRADGVFSQMGFVFPEYNACVITTGGEIYSRKMLDCFFKYLPQLFEIQEGEPAVPASEIPGMPDYPVLPAAPRSPITEEHLEGRTVLFPSTIQQLPKVVGYPVSVMPFAVFFMSADKAGGIDKVRFRFQQDTLKFSWSEGEERNTVLCGMDGSARLCKIKLGGIEFIVSCSAAWEGADKLHVWIRPASSVTERRMVFSFRGRQVRLLPRSAPPLSSMTEYAAPHALALIPNPVLGQIVSKGMDAVVQFAEPPHYGYLK